MSITCTKFKLKLYNANDWVMQSLLQSMTLGFGTYKPFGPVLMRTLLARIHKIDQATIKNISVSPYPTHNFRSG